MPTLAGRTRLSLTLAGAAAAAVVAALPITTLIAPGWVPRIALTPAGRNTNWFAWGPEAMAPDVLREAALIDALRGLAAVVACVLVIAVAGVLALGATRAARLSPDLRVHRMVGASRKHLWGGELVHAGILTLMATTVGVLMGAAFRLNASDFPGNVGEGALVMQVLVPVAAFILLMLAAVPVILGALRVQAHAGPARPVALAVPMLLVAAASIALATTTGFSASLSSHAPAPDLATVGAVDTREAARPTAPPGVGIASPGLVTGLGTVDFVTTDCGNCYQSGIAVQWHHVRAVHHFANADTFDVLGIGLLAGRLFGTRESEPVAIVSRSLAGRHFEGGQAVGRRIMLGHDGVRWYRVIGVVADRPAQTLGADDLPPTAVYLSPTQVTAHAWDLLNAAGPNATAASAVFAADRAPVAWFASRLAFAGRWGALLAIAAIGIVMFAWGRALVPELAIRRAVGATRTAILSHVLGRVLLVGGGGIALAWWVGLMLWDLYFPAFVFDVGGPVAQVPRIAAGLALVAALATAPGVWTALRRPPALLLDSAT